MGHKWNKYLASAPDKLDPILSLDRCLIVLSDAQDLASPRKTISGKKSISYLHGGDSDTRKISRTRHLEGSDHPV